MGKLPLATLLFGGIFLPFSALAQAAPLAEGQTRSEVSKLLGPPIERMERETKREEEWRYERSSVTFREGKVKDWSPRVAEPTNPTDPEAAGAAGKNGSDKDSELANILGVILEEGGDSEASPPKPPAGVPPGVTIIDAPNPNPGEP